MNGPRPLLLAALAALALAGCDQRVGAGAGGPPDPFYNLVAADVGLAAMQEGRWEIALRAWRRVMVQEGPTLRALVGTGISLRALGRLNQAEEVLGIAVREHPGSAAAHNALGGVLFDRRQYDRARAAFVASAARAEAEGEGVLASAARLNAEIAAAAMSLDPEDLPESGPRAIWEVVAMGGGRYVLSRSRGEEFAP